MTVRLPIARMGPDANWFVEGDGWTMRPSGRDLSISEAKRICMVTAGALRDADARAGAQGEGVG